MNSSINPNENAPSLENEAQPLPQAEVSSEDTLKAELQEWKERALRALAEVENVRKRAQKDVEDAKNFSMANFAKDMLLIGDNIHRALQAIDKKDRDGAEGLFKSLIDGVEMTQHELVRLFERHGITPISAKGEKFNPNLHQAMFEIPTQDAAPGTVVEEVQSGYVLKERVLRPAFVGVAKSPDA